MKPIPGLVEGRIVLFRPAPHQQFKHPDRDIPAIVVRVWSAEGGCVNLRLFADGTNDHNNWREHDWQTSVEYDPTGKKPYSWRFPAKVEPAKAE